jgi:hypothetical protein
MADEADSKSVVGNHVRVQVPLPAVEIAEDQKEKAFSVFYMRRMHRRSCLLSASVLHGGRKRRLFWPD